MVCSCFGLAEDKVAFGANHLIAYAPLISFALILGMEDKGAHAFNGITVVYAKIDHRDVGLATNDRQNTYEQGYHPCAHSISFCHRASSNVVDHLKHSFLHL